MNLIEINEFASSPGIIEKLNRFGVLKSFRAEETVLGDQALISAIPIVLNGSIRVMRTEDDGREILLYYIRPGESCIMSFLGGIHHNTSKVLALAEEQTDILFVPIDKVLELIKEYLQWLDYIFKLYHKRFEELLEVVNAVAFKKMDERLLSFLQKKCQISGSNILFMTHEQLAGELGTARVVVSRLLKKMEEENLVSLGRNKIILL